MSSLEIFHQNYPLVIAVHRAVAGKNVSSLPENYMGGIGWDKLGPSWEREMVNINYLYDTCRGFVQVIFKDQNIEI